MTSAKRRALAAGATLGASAVLATSAQAATFTVTSTSDDAAGGTCAASCTLRDAISAANNDGTADTITFASGLSGTITLTNGPLDLTDVNGVTITGPGAGTLTVSAGGAFQVFDVNDQASISGLTITRGAADGDGGAIDQTAATLSLVNDTISDSSSSGVGGGVYTDAALTITDCTITGNTALSGGGVATGTYSRGAVTISASQISDNHATSTSDSDGSGGGIYADAGSLSLTGSTVSGNTSTNAGGGITSETKYGTTISGSTISGNTSATGGGLEVTGVNTGEHQASDNTVSVGTSTISGDDAPDGAGVEIGRDQTGTPIMISASTISGNTGGASSFGGGLLITGPAYNPIDLTDSTVSGNSATDGGGVSLSDGGTQPLIASGSGSIALDNSTIAANSAGTSGGGIYLGDYTPGPTSGTATLDSTIVAGNTAVGAEQDLAKAAGATGGGFDTAFSVLQQPGTGLLLTSQSDILGQPAQLGALANNGGPTETMLPASSSPAVDQGRANGLSTDQRGDPRTVKQPGVAEPPGGDGTDIGSVELPAPSVTPPPSPSSSAPALTFGAPEVTSGQGVGLSGLVNPEGLATTSYFEYGIDPSDRGPGSSSVLYDQTTTVEQVGSDFSEHTVSASVSGLVPNALYHVRMVATNSDGSTYGPDTTFRTKPDPSPPPPVLGKTVNVSLVSGRVFIEPPPGKSLGTANDRAGVSKGQGFVPLTEVRSIPTGSEIDALHGSLKIVSNSGKVGKTQTATLTGGVFKLTQARTGISKGLTGFNLVESAFQGAPSYGLCTAKHKASDATIAKLSSKTLQLLKVSGHGEFRTTGRYSAATVRGTIYTVADRCDGTLTHVIRDTVLVDDFARHKTILLHAGQSYLAKAIATRK